MESMTGVSLLIHEVGIGADGNLDTETFFVQDDIHLRGVRRHPEGCGRRPKPAAVRPSPTALALSGASTLPRGRRQNGFAVRLRGSPAAAVRSSPTTLALSGALMRFRDYEAMELFELP